MIGVPPDLPRTIDVHARALSPRLVELTVEDRQRIKCGNALGLLGMSD